MNMVVDLSGALKAAISPDAAARQAAEAQLASFRDQNLPGYLASLIAELNNDTREADVRQAAGLMLKNAVDAREDVRKKELQAKWIAIDPTIKQHVRDMLLQCLQSPVAEVGKTAALAVAKVAAIDLPRGEWPGLIQALLNNMGVQGGGTATRMATLKTMGFVCEEMATLNKEVLSASEVSMVLTAVVAGMGATEPTESRLAATEALRDAIEFAHHNFENDVERNYLMQVVCSGTQSPEIRIRCTSFECLHEIAAYYYGKLQPYMTEIYTITVKAIKEDQEEVALQAIEFWSTVCDTELELLEEDDPDEPCHRFIAAACPHLTPIMLELLTKQEDAPDAQDEGSWNLAMAAGTCLGLVAKVVQDAVVPLVIPFVTANISKNSGQLEDWRYREAATFAFGSVLEGPSPGSLLEIVKQALPFLLQALKDPNPYVKDTTAWTIGRVFEFLHDAHIEPPLITKDALPQVMSALLEALKDEPAIAYRVCCAIGQLAAGFKGAVTGDTSPMSPFFSNTVQALLTAAEVYGNHDRAKVQVAAYEAINDMVRASSRDTLDVVVHLIQMALQLLHRTFEIPAVSPEQRERVAEVQGQLCGMLQVIIQKLSEADDTKAGLVPFADPIMEALMRVFHARSSTVHEEAMLAVGSFTYAVGRNFAKYLPQFFPILRTGLTNYQEWQVCLSTVGVLGDVCRNVEDGIAPFCDELVSLMLQDLGREDVHRTVKPQILSTFGDIALVLGDKFDKYLEPVLRVLKQAMGLSVSMQSNDPDSFDYNNELRQGILDAYSGIMQGLGPASAERYLKPEVPAVVEFVSSIGVEQEYDDEVAKAAANLLGDLCSVMAGVGSVLNSSPQQGWKKLMQHCQEQGSTMPDTEWAIQQVQHALRSS